MQQSNRKTQPSKLEIFIDILKVLLPTGPLKIAHIEDKVNLKPTALKEKLDFLTKQRLVEEQIITNNNTVYAITKRGISVLKYFKEYTQGIPVAKEV
jgi:predicted transcriptional regulator